MTEEVQYLDYTLEKYDEVIEDSKLKLKNLRKLYAHNYDAMLDEKERLEHDIEVIEKAKNSPYFARIDFESKNHFEKCYIGKKGVIDYDHNIITVDWRAPIASLYYDSNVGSCQYEAPEGMIQGQLKLKRQYTIEKKKLIQFNDVDTVSNDELLKPYLDVSADVRLKNIVSTIQSEQNQIIREKLGQDMVIQGVAGSGKTTVALHRIAYLVYNYRNLFKAKDYMVIGPNKFFVNYISDILPDLDVNGVAESTLDELCLDYVKENFNIYHSLDILKDNDEEAAFKTSMRMKKRIDEYFQKLEVIPLKDFCIYDKKIIDRKVILSMYKEIDKKRYKSVQAQVERMILLLEKYIDQHINTIISQFIKEGESQKLIKEIKENRTSHLKKYFTVMNKKIKMIYIDILNDLGWNTSKIKKNEIQIEDLPSLMYIKYKLNGSEEYHHYKHIVIDEAQDYGAFTFYALKKMFQNASFSIYGDLAQSLYSYRSLSDWKELQNIFPALEIVRLNKSYRTTIEIMEEANKINQLLGLDQAIPVIRHGEEVEYVSNSIIKLAKQISQQYKTIAIITKNQDQANHLYQQLKDHLDVTLIDSSHLTYNSSINIIPSYLSKGLEFDAVIIDQIGQYNKDHVLDMKLLYVSMTRALHKLYMVESK